MIARGYRFLGWVCVAMGVCFPFGCLWRLHIGVTTVWWEYLAFLGGGGFLVLMGLSLALPNPGPRFALVALLTVGAFSIALGLASLLKPAAMLVRHGRGPRTVFTAQLSGGIILVTGIAIIWAAVDQHRRRRRTAIRDAVTPPS